MVVSNSFFIFTPKFWGNDHLYTLTSMFNWVGSTTWLDLELVYKPSQRSHCGGDWTSHRLVGSSCWHFEAERHHQGNGANLSTITFPETSQRVCPGVLPPENQGWFFLVVWWLQVFFASTKCTWKSMVGRWFVTLLGFGLCSGENVGFKVLLSPLTPQKTTTFWSGRFWQ